MIKSKNCYQWLTKLIAFDTTSCYSNLDLIHYLQEYFESLGLHSQLSLNAKGDKANIFATIPAENKSQENGLILSGHTDVVPVSGQKWATDPFSATEIKDRIYGRGTADMKGFLAVVLALIPQFLQLPLKKPLHFAFSFDEEVGCTGAPLLIADLAKQGLKPAACLVGEPTLMRPVIAHKGVNGFRCRIQGRAAHSSLTTLGCNAIEYAAEFICWLRNFAKQLKIHEKQDALYEVPHSSLSTNMIQGGNAMNTIPEVCEFFFDFRNLPATCPKNLIESIRAYLDQELLPKMQQEYAAASVELDAVVMAPGLEIAEEADLTKLVRSLCEDKRLSKVPYGTEAGLFHQAGIPTLVCGPGSIEQAHRADEYIELSQLRACESFLLELVKIFNK